jgi:SAM-dependent methyltransferase
MRADAWDDGAGYESYVGRWSRPVARVFLDWLDVPRHGAWLDVGCGTGAVSETILAQAAPRLLVGCDRSPDYVALAGRRLGQDIARFVTAELPDLPTTAGGFDAVVSGLVLNFLPDPKRALVAMRERVKRGGVVAAYVWDYAQGMELMRIFWDEAVALDAHAAALDEGARFPVCEPVALRALFQAAGLGGVEVRAIDVPTVFRDFDDYWTPFLSGQGPAPGYAMQLSPQRRERLRERIRLRLAAETDGTIALHARAWAARGSVG